MTRVLHILATLLAAYAALCLLLFVFQRSLLYFPQARTPQALGSIVSLQAEDAQLQVSVLKRPGSQAIVYFGGNAEDVAQNLPQWSKSFPDHSLYLLHYRGYGGSTGKPSEEANHRDAALLLAYVRQWHADVSVIGRSLGSGVAIKLAADAGYQGAVQRLILITPYDSVTEVAARVYPFVPVRWLLRDRYESVRHAPQVRVPTLLLAAEHDEVIPLQHTRELLPHFAPGVARLEVLSGVGHNNLQAAPRYFPLMAQALQAAPAAVSSQ